MIDIWNWNLTIWPQAISLSYYSRHRESRHFKTSSCHLHTYMHTYIHTYIYTYILTQKCFTVPLWNELVSSNNSTIRYPSQNNIFVAENLKRFWNIIYNNKNSLQITLSSLDEDERSSKYFQDHFSFSVSRTQLDIFQFSRSLSLTDGRLNPHLQATRNS